MLLEQVINGLVVGSVYALIALGYTLVFGVLEKFNFSHPEVFMLGGFVPVAVIAATGSLWLAVPAVIFVSSLMGLLIELISFRRFKSADAQITAALSSLALGMILVDLVHKILGDRSAISGPSVFLHERRYRPRDDPSYLHQAGRARRDLASDDSPAPSNQSDSNSGAASARSRTTRIWRPCSA